jgi:hypothetical protein
MSVRQCAMGFQSTEGAFLDAHRQSPRDFEFATHTLLSGAHRPLARCPWDGFSTLTFIHEKNAGRYMIGIRMLRKLLCPAIGTGRTRRLVEFHFA